MIEAYYQDDYCTIYHGDCRDILPLLDPVDLVLTDPPYNVGVSYGQHDDDMNQDTLKKWIESWFIPCLDIADTVLINDPVNMLIYGNLAQWKWLLCWYKPAAMGRSPVGFMNWEPVMMWGKGGKTGNDVVKAPIISDSSITAHPCPKPLAWGTGFISLFSTAETILDPFMGSGTTLVAAKDLQRQAIGIEIDEKYCEIAADRLASFEPLPLLPVDPAPAECLELFTDD